MNRQVTLLLALAILLVGALWWLFLYSPGQDELAMIEDDIAAAEAETQSLQTRIAQLEAVRAAAPETEALIAQLDSIVPGDPALPAAIRQIEAAAQDAGVRIETLTTSLPSEVADVAPGLHRISVSMSVAGSYFQLVDFLRRLENPGITARGIQFSTVSLSASEYPTLQGSLTGSMFAVLDPVPDAETATTDETESDEGEADDEPAESDADSGEPVEEEGGVQ